MRIRVCAHIQEYVYVYMYVYMCVSNGYLCLCKHYRVTTTISVIDMCFGSCPPRLRYFV